VSGGRFAARIALASALAVLAAGLVSVAAGPSAPAAGPAAAPPARAAAAFDGRAALRHVERLVAIGPRPAGSPAGARAREYIAGELRRPGIAVRVLPFEAATPGGPVKMANVVAVVAGRRPDVILIGGHYDTKVYREFPFVGANDGGSSTALLIELARALARGRPEFTYWVTFFDGEEALVNWTADDSLYGSRHLAAELGRTRRLPRAVIVADMIGDRDLGIRREAHSTPWLTDLIWAAARRLGHGQHFLPDTMAVEDDHAPFLRAGVPAALLIDFDYPPWHTADDTVDKVAARSLQIVGDVLLAALPDLEMRLRAPGPPRP
jgi:Zn-dependent M28 family amino/carboxypeptidase